MNALTEDNINTLARFAIEAGEDKVVVEIGGHKATIHVLDNSLDIQVSRPVLEALLK